MPFENVLKQLVKKVANVQPNPFFPFIDIEAMQKYGGDDMIWNADGDALMVRLREFYEYVKTS